jgi:hypothetical protein
VAPLSGLGKTDLVCSSNGTTTTIIAARPSGGTGIGLASYAFDIEEGSPIRMNPAAANGEESTVTDFDRTTGTLTVSPPFSAAAKTAAGEPFEAWRKCVHSVGDVDKAINRALPSRCFYWHLTPLGMLVAGDCETITGWTASVSALAVAAHAFPWRFGRYYLTVTNAGYAYQNLNVVPSTNWNIAVLMRMATTGGTVSVSVYDNVGAAVVSVNGDSFTDTAGSTQGTPWRMHVGSFTTPVGCDSIAIRLNSVGATKVAHFAWIALWPSDAPSISLPDRITSEKFVGSIFAARQVGSEAYGTNMVLEECTGMEPTREGYGGLSVRLSRSYLGPFFVEERSPYPQLTGDYHATDATVYTTDCPEDWISYAAAYELMLAVARREQAESGKDKALPYFELAAELEAEGNKIIPAYITSPSVVVRG